MAQTKIGGQLSGHPDSDMSEDPRAAHTESVLKQALMSLLEQGDWNGITVAGISRHAGVARSSFYEHYRTKSDLLDQVFSDMMISIRIAHRADAPLGTLDWLVDHVAAAPDFFVRSMEGARGDALLPRFRRALTRQLSKELRARGTPNAEASASFIIGGSMAYLASAERLADRAFIHEIANRLIRTA